LNTLKKSQTEKNFSDIFNIISLSEKKEKKSPNFHLGHKSSQELSFDMLKSITQSEELNSNPKNEPESTKEKSVQESSEK